MSYDSIKRMLDIVIALTLGLLISPLIVLGILFILVIDQHTPFFAQERLGKNQQIFKCYKLRTMRSGHEPDQKRVTRLGRLIRKTSLDELPQLWNVLKGEMSLVGPRPFLPEYGPLYSEYQNRRHEVRPGITGWAQVHRRSTDSWKARFDLDVYYVDHYSLRMDLMIMLRTIWEITVDLFSSKAIPFFEKFTGNEA